MKLGTKAIRAAAVLSAALLMMTGAAAQSDDDWFFTDMDDMLFTVSDDAFFGGSDDDLFEDDMLFGGDDMFGEEITVESSASSGTSIFSGLDLINTEKVRFGGSASFGLSSGVNFNNVFSEDAGSWDYWSDALGNTNIMPSIGATLYFDAHPSDTLRFYGKARINYPFETTTEISAINKQNFDTWKAAKEIKDNLVSHSQPVPPELEAMLDMQETAYSVKVPSFSVSELFTDFDLGDTLFFRFGKHTVKWGVGYFFSPADVINLGSIDPENPTADREGPVSLRVQEIFPGTQNYLYGYVVLGDKMLLKDTSIALKYEFLAGNYEIGLGAWYHDARPPRIMTTVTGSLGKANVFAEGVAAWGYEEEWTSSPSFSGKTPVFQATLGGSYSWSDPGISLFAQYFYNGFGVPSLKDSSLLELLGKSMLYQYCGQHYLATSISKSKLFGSNDMSLSLFGLMSLTDFSGMASLSLGTQLFKNCNLSFGPSFTFGPEKSEYMYPMLIEDIMKGYSPSDEKWRCNMGFSVSLSFGGGRF